MSSTVAAATPHARTFQKERRERLFYVIACVVMLVGVAVGFHMFYLHGLNDAEPVLTVCWDVRVRCRGLLWSTISLSVSLDTKREPKILGDA